MKKYLDRYAEPETAALAGLPEQAAWRNVMVIPACNEAPAFLRQPPPCGGRSLMILVINESKAATGVVSRQNKALASAVFERFELAWSSDVVHASFALQLYRDPLAQRDVLLVDRFSEGFQLPEKGGVGHARKTGVDIACALVAAGRVESPWIHCTDADVRLPETYFTASQSVSDRAKDHAVLIYPFYHTEDTATAKSAEVVLATQLYELSLRYYVAGMKSAGSPYAFHTIGSTMAVSARHYAMVRGFPKREAGEDFYLLNKLAKVGKVLELSPGPGCRPIEIEARRSDRVPFGTGAAVNKMTGLADLLADYQFYDPLVFELLACWLNSIKLIWHSPGKDIATSVFPETAENGVPDKRQQCLLRGLEEIGVSRALQHAFGQSKSLQQFERHMVTWFDAFKTLKLVHKLRDCCAGSIRYEELQKHVFFQHLTGLDRDLAAFYSKLSQKLDSRHDSVNLEA